MMKVLVVGAAGAAAGMVVPALARRGVQVRGLVHDAAKEEATRASGATETAVDLGDVEALTAAADGVDGVFGIIPAFAADEAGIGMNIVQAAVSAGARKIVLSSIYHPSPTALSNHREKQPAEAAMYDADLDFTVLQPAIFRQQRDGLWDSAAKGGTIA